MLQIASGKLFADSPQRTNELRGVAYTNLQLVGRQTIDTVAGRLLPTSTLPKANPVIYEVTEQIEDTGENQSLASYGIEPYLSDFSVILSFALHVTCTPDQELTRSLTDGRSKSLGGPHPQALLPRVFEASVQCKDEDIAYFENFTRDLIGLERETYLAVMRAIRTYVNALRQIRNEPELTYTMLVAALESLAQGFDGHVPSWEDYPEANRRRIDEVLQNTEEQTKRKAQKILLEIEHVKASRRFYDFVFDNINPGYFRQEAIGLRGPVGRAELRNSLRQAYGLRSGHIHRLKELPAVLKIGFQQGEVFGQDEDALLTFRGLARLAHHVITEFIKRQPKVESERYDYSAERSGIIKVPFAPRYWLGSASGLTASSGHKRLEGFLLQVAQALQQNKEAAVTDLRDMLSRAQKLLGSTNEMQRRPFLALFVLFNRLVVPEAPMAKFAAVVERYGSELQRPSVEALLLNLLLGNLPEWTLAEHQAVHDEYLKNQGKANHLRVPPVMRAGLALALAERYRVEGDQQAAQRLICAAVENCPGVETLLRLEEALDLEVEVPWRIQLPVLQPTDNPSPDRMSGGRVVMQSDILING